MSKSRTVGSEHQKCVFYWFRDSSLPAYKVQLRGVLPSAPKGRGAKAKAAVTGPILTPSSIDNWKTQTQREWQRAKTVREV